MTRGVPDSSPFSTQTIVKLKNGELFFKGSPFFGFLYLFFE